VTIQEKKQMPNNKRKEREICLLGDSSVPRGKKIREIQMTREKRRRRSKRWEKKHWLQKKKKNPRKKKTSGRGNGEPKDKGGGAGLVLESKGTKQNLFPGRDCVPWNHT